MSPGLVRKLVRNMECGIGIDFLRGGHCATSTDLYSYSRAKWSRLNVSFQEQLLVRRFSSFVTSPGAFVEEEKASTHLSWNDSTVASSGVLKQQKRSDEPEKQADEQPEPKLTVIAFDIETTGFKTEGHRIIEFAARDLSGGQSSTISALVNPGRYVPHIITQITGITNEMVNQPNIPSWKEVGPEIIRFVESRRQGDQPLVLVAHNGRTFDVPFLLKEFQSCSIEVPGSWLFLDSLALARETKKKHRYNWTSLRLSDIYDSYGLQRSENAHRAMADVNMLASVLEMLVADLQLAPAEFLSKAFTLEDLLAASKRLQVQEKEAPASGGDMIPEGGKDIDPEIGVVDAEEMDDSHLENGGDESLFGVEPELSKSFIDTGSVDAAVLSFRLRKYVEQKRQRPDFIHLLAAGEFYEAFFEDAESLAATCKIALSLLNDGEVNIPAARFLASKSYLHLHSLLESGAKIVKIDDSNGENVSVLTPGMLLQEGLVDESRNNFLASVNVADDRAGSWGLAYCDISTGELYATQSTGLPALVEELHRLEPAEVVLNLKALSVIPSGMLRSTQASSEFSRATEDSLLTHNCDGDNVESLRKWEISDCATGALLRYVQEIQGQELPFRKLIIYNSREYLFLANNTRKFLKLDDSSRKEESLFWAMDSTKTTMGSRLLRKWLLQPLRSLEQIRLRQNALKVLLSDASSRGALRSILTSVVDIEHTAASLVRQKVPSWDYMISLSDSLLLLSKLSLALEKLPENFYFSEVRRHEPTLSKLAEQIQEKRKERIEEEDDNVSYTEQADEERIEEEDDNVSYTEQADEAVEEAGEPTLLQIQKAIGDLLTALQETSQALAALDVLCSFAETAATRNYCIPELAPDGRDITITKGRHPVVELVQDFTPNSCLLGNKPGSSAPDLLIITGNKGSGKSSYLQQVALTQLLAQCGSAVPAKQAKLSIADAIYYTSGLSEVKSFLEKATSNSLVLLDDFESPAGVRESEALSTAVIEYLASQANSRSLVCMESYELELQEKYSNISACTMRDHAQLAGLVSQPKALDCGGFPAWIRRRVMELTGAESDHQQQADAVEDSGSDSDSTETPASAVESSAVVFEGDLKQLWRQATTLLQSSPATLALAKQKGSLVSISTVSEPAIVRIGSSRVFFKKFRQQEHAAALEAAFESLLNQPVKLEVVEQSD